jgi:hypothetical protein
MKTRLNLVLLRDFIILVRYYVFCVLNENDINGTQYSFVQLVLLEEQLNRSRR